MDVSVGWYDTSFSVRTEFVPSSWGGWWWEITCNPVSVTNGTVNSSTCQITCNTGYALSGTQCLLSDEEAEIESSTWDDTEEIIYELFDTTSVNLLSPFALTIPQSAQCAWVEELQQAYQFAYGIGITTMSTASQARLCDGVTRAEMAKMMVNYAQTVANLSEDSSRACSFDDISSQPAELQWYIVQACKLGIMGVWIGSFYPNASVDRWQFGTALSRVLYGDLYNDSDPYYMSHLAALYNADIIKNMTASLQELRWYVMLMMMRAAE